MAESTNMKEALNNFFKSAEFKSMIKDAVEDAVQKATAPLLRKISMLESQLAEAKAHANDNEQYVRKYNLRFVGLDEEEGEDCREKIVSFCKDTLDTLIDDKEIDRAHRVGPRKADKTRPIIVKFKSYDTKMMITKKKSALKGTRIYINEDLTKENAKTFNFILKNCKTTVKSVWVADGKILARNNDGKILRIRKFDDLHKFNLYSANEYGYFNVFDEQRRY